MSTRNAAVAALSLACVAGVAAYWLNAGAPAPEGGAAVAPAPEPTSPPRAEAVPRPAPTPLSPTPAGEPAPIAEAIVDDHGEEHDHREVEDPTHDLELYAEYPMSPVPHRVVRGWGARGAGKRPGVVGAYVIVDPGIDDETLAKLASDIRAYHSDAHALSVRILDSERAATYDRHSDGGELLAAHLVGLVNRNEGLGLDQIMIRGEEIEPSSASATASP